MKPKQAVLFFLLISAAGFSYGSGADSANSSDLNNELEKVKKIANDARDCLTDAADNLTDMMKTLPPDINERLAEVIAPYLIQIVQLISPPSFFPFDMISNIPPEVMLKIGSMLETMMPQMNDIFNSMSSYVKEMILGDAPESGQQQALVRKRRDSSSMTTAMYDEVYGMFSRLVKRLSTLSLNTLDEAVSDSFDVGCRAGMLMYNSMWSNDTIIDCDKYATMLSDNPLEFVMTIMTLVMNNMSTVVADAVVTVSEMMWSYSKSTLIPMLYTELNKMKDSGQLPDNMSSMVSTFDTVYSMLKMFGVL